MTIGRHEQTNDHSLVRVNRIACEEGTLDDALSNTKLELAKCSETLAG